MDRWYEVGYSSGSPGKVLKLHVYTVETNTEANWTKERADLWLGVTSTAGSYWNNYGSPAGIEINGNSTQQNPKWDARSVGDKLLIGTFDTVVAHDGNGDASIAVRGWHQSGTALGSAETGHQGYQCDHINRYPNIRIDSASSTINSITLNCSTWGVGAEVFHVYNGDTLIGGYNSLPITIENLPYNTNYGNLRVAALGNGGAGWSNSINISTRDKNRFYSTVKDLTYGKDYEFQFVQNAGAATIFNIYNKEKDVLIASRTNIQKNANLGEIFNYTFQYSNDELDTLLKLFEMNNEIEVVVQIETEWFGSHYYDEHIKKCFFDGDSCSVVINVGGETKRGKVWIGTNKGNKKGVLVVGTSTGNKRGK